MMIFYDYTRCPKCGSEAGDADVCPSCGAVFAKVRSREIEEEVFGSHIKTFPQPAQTQEPHVSNDRRRYLIIAAVVAVGLAWGGWKLHDRLTANDPAYLVQKHRELISKALKTVTSGETLSEKAGRIEADIKEGTALRARILRLQNSRLRKDALKAVRVTALLYANELLDLEFDSVANDIALGLDPGRDLKLFVPVETVLKIAENPYSGVDQAAAANEVLKNYASDPKVIESLRATGDQLAERRRQVREQIALTMEGLQKAKALKSFDEMHFPEASSGPTATAAKQTAH